jgi:beta-lactam-binding protein with PASTA domain
MGKVKAFFHLHKKSWLFRIIIILLVIFIVLAIIDNIVMPLYVKLGDEIEMPDVIEMSVQEATTLLAENGFQVVIKDSLYDADHAVGIVIEQNPYPYAMVKDGRRVYLTISIGEKPIIMPKLFGVSPREAELILDTYGLKLRSKSYVPSDMYHEGTVMAQSYPPGQPIKGGTGIDITISLGQLKEDMKIPDLIGKSLHEARERLKALNIKIGEITFEERDNILPETVLDQSLKPGTIFEPKDVIDLTVSVEKTN